MSALSNKNLDNVVFFKRDSCNESSYIPEEVIFRFAHKREISIDVATKIFSELLSFLDTASSEQSSPSKIIDDAWHEFILHTALYQSFCKARYGRFIHHIPTSLLACKNGQGENDDCGAGVSMCSSDCSSGCSSSD